MKRQKYTILFPAFLLLAAHLALCSQATAAGQGKSSSKHGGGQASTHMSAKGSANSNAQWSADPTRGWIRADERHDLSKTNERTQNKYDKEKPKANANANGH